MENSSDRSDEKKSDGDHPKPSDYSPYPKLDSIDLGPPPPLPPPPTTNPDDSGVTAMGSQIQAQLQSDSGPSKIKSPSTPQKSVSWSSELTREAPLIPEHSATTMPTESNPYVSAASPAPSASSSLKNTMFTVKEVLGRWGKKVGEKTKKAEDLAGNVWQHLKTGPSVADAAIGRIAQGTKVIAEGGYEKIFRQTFETVPEEQLQRSYACYLSTSAGPVMGILYMSSAKLAFCSDNPLPYKVRDQTEWSYYKVVIPLHQLKAVTPSTSKVNSAEKYIQVASVDNHEFWFMGFVNYDSAVKHLQEALLAYNLQST